MEYNDNPRLARTKGKAQENLKKPVKVGTTQKVMTNVSKKGKKVGGTTVKTCV